MGRAGVSLWCAIFIIPRHMYYFEERKVIKAELFFLLMDLLAWDNTEFAINGKSV